MASFSDLQVRRALLMIGVIAAAIYLGFNIPENPMGSFFMVAGVAYVLTLGINYWWCAWLFFAFSSSALIIPALPGRPFLWEALAAAAWPAVFVHLGLNRTRFSEIGFSRLELRALLCLVIYLGVVVMLMAVHGVGFRALGGTQMGGRFYVQQIVLGIVPLLFLLAPWSRERLLTAFVASVVLSATYIVSDFALISGGRVAQLLLNFFEVPTDAFHFYYGFELTGLRRYQSFSIVGRSLLLLLLAAFPLQKLVFRRFYFGWPCLAAILLLGLLSGERTRLVQTGLTLLVLGWVQRLYTPPRVVALGLAFAVAGGLVYWQADRLPLSVQRAFSFLPGISVDPVAATDAAGTLHDRIAVVKLAIQAVPDYLLMGRGFGMERFDQTVRSVADDGVVLAFQNGQFPNGVVSLLVNTGLWGFLAAAGYIVAISRVAVEVVRAVANRSEEERGWFERFAQLSVAHWFAMVAFFFLLHGEASTFVPTFALPGALLLVCRRLLVPPPPAALAPT